MQYRPKSRLQSLRALPWAAVVAAILAVWFFAWDMPALTRPAPPVIEPGGGILTSPVRVTVADEVPGAEIYLGRNGVAPAPGAGARYTGPLEIETTTILRAASVRPWIANSFPAAASFLFPADIARQPDEPPGLPMEWRGLHLKAGIPDNAKPDYGMDPRVAPDNTAYVAAISEALRDLPSVSLVMDQSDLFDLDRGIYVNSSEKGMAWERPVSVEYFEKDGTRAFQVNAGIRIHGMSARQLNYNPKQGFRILFRNDYGPGMLHYPLFGEARETGIDALLLRNLTHDSWVYHDKNSFGEPHYIRDDFARESQRAAGHPIIRSQFVHLYLNGLYWGLYSLCERVDASYLRDRLGGGRAGFDIVKGTELGAGTWDAWNELRAMCEGPHDAFDYEAMAERVDIDNLIDYILINQYTDNTDWFAANAFAVRRRDGDGRFKFLIYDAEVTFGARPAHFDFLDFHQITRRLAAKAFTPAHLVHRLMREPEFRLRFADRVQHLFFNGGALTVNNAQRRWNSLADSIDTAIVAEAARWGDCNEEKKAPSLDGWRARIESVAKTFFPERHAYLLERYRNEGLLPRVDPPEMQPHGGILAPGGAVQLGGPEGAAIYYTTDGADPRLPGGEVNTRHAVRYAEPIRITTTTAVKARALLDETWSAMVETTFTPKQ